MRPKCSVEADEKHLLPVPGSTYKQKRTGCLIEVLEVVDEPGHGEVVYLKISGNRVGIGAKRFIKQFESV